LTDKTDLISKIIKVLVNLVI